MDNLLLFYILLFLLAALYSSVGHGGASGYLALMAIYEISPDIIRPSALLLNLFVSLIAFIQFNRAGGFRWKIFIPLIIGSIPLAFLGGLMQLDDDIYKISLGILLLIPVVRFIFMYHADESEIKTSSPLVSVALGGCIGFISGLIGIGGGIILSPILIFLKWSNQKQTAAVSALFIFVNSAAGLAGNYNQGLKLSTEIYGYVLIAFSGGLVGSYLGAIKFKPYVLKNTLAFVLFVAACKLILT